MPAAGFEMGLIAGVQSPPPAEIRALLIRRIRGGTVRLRIMTIESESTLDGVCHNSHSCRLKYYPWNLRIAIWFWNRFPIPTDHRWCFVWWHHQHLSPMKKVESVSFSDSHEVDVLTMLWPFGRWFLTCTIIQSFVSSIVESLWSLGLISSIFYCDSSFPWSMSLCLRKFTCQADVGVELSFSHR